MAYEYVASTQTGKLRRGKSRLISRDAVIRELESRGLIVVSVEEAKPMRAVERAGALLFGSIGHVERVLFTKHLTVMLKAGLTLLESLSILEDQASSWRLKRIVRRLAKRVEGGGRISDAFEEFPRVFSAFYVNIVRAGEVSGALDQNLEHLALQLTKEHELRKKVQSTMLYPVIVLISASLIGFYFAVYVIPQIANLFSNIQGIQLPLVTRILLATAKFFRQYTFSSFFGLVALIIAIFWVLRLKVLAPVTHKVVLRLPIIGKIVRNVNLARFALVFGTLLRSGVPISQAIEVTSDVLGNVYYKKALRRVFVEIQRGVPASEGLIRHPRLFPKIASRMVGVGERSGKLEEVLGYLAEFYELEVDTSVKNLSTALEPILLLFIGSFALALAYAILIPIYQFIAAIRRI